MTAEHERLEASRNRTEHWKRWGPYLAERAWGTVRENYGDPNGMWEYLSHDQARSRAYRWNEDGIGGICDRHQKICFSIALWNGSDEILKERLFGLTNHEGRHGEDVKECYYYLESTPTHSYMKFLYRYPQEAFPYKTLVKENDPGNRDLPEFELTDTGIFDDNRYFDVLVEYAKASAEDIFVRITATNQGSGPATLRLLPTVWFRNTWSWGRDHEPRPALRRCADRSAIELEESAYGKRWMVFEGNPTLLFTENETNNRHLFGSRDASPYVKDGIANFVVHGAADAVNPAGTGTKAAACYVLQLQSGESRTIRARFTDTSAAAEVDGDAFESVFALRKQEADEFYSTVIPTELSDDARNVMRQSLAGLMWSKQFYHYVVKDWLEGDPCCPPPLETHKTQNSEWSHVFAADVISMPDKWEYPWFACWDLAFHCLPIALIDSDFAKDQLSLMVREWYMHPNGQIPAYEWKFSDVNPPVHAWAAFRVYKIEQKRRGTADRIFLERIFHKLMLNFTWWVNRKDAEGRNLFEGGFLGLDNIGLFDRSRSLPHVGLIEQADGTGWMAMYSLNLLAIAMELARDDPAYEDVASKFWEHFLYIADAMTHVGPDNFSLWSETDGFFYDALRLEDGTHMPVRIRSAVGLIALFAVETLECEQLKSLSGFRRRMDWFIEHRPDLTKNVASMRKSDSSGRLLLSILDEEQLRRVLRVMLDENEFLSPYGIRALSKYYAQNPYTLSLDDVSYSIKYEPAESSTPMFGGNSNWRGPVWFPLNYLLIESLQKFHHYYGDDFRVEFPTGSGIWMNLWDVAAELSRRLTRIFLMDEQGKRPVHGGNSLYQHPEWKDLVLFYEYFHGDNGAGIGASHQTGWTGLVAKLLQQSGD